MLAARAARHAAVAAALARLDDREVTALLDARPLEIAGTPVFAKRIPLTALELDHPGSTANLFDLPVWYQYGIGSAGFGAWRELAAQTMATDWVLSGACAGFPLLHHHRVLGPMPDPHAAHLERICAWWGGHPAIRARLEAMASAPASLVMVLERIPHVLADWLPAQRDEVACAMVEQSADEVIAFLRDRGLVHFDAHVHNILTDGARLYFADFGLASTPAFDLTAAERAFAVDHALYDGCLVRRELVNGLAARFTAWPYIERHGAVAAIMNDFFGRLRDDKQARYPRDELAAAYVDDVPGHPTAVLGA